MFVESRDKTLIEISVQYQGPKNQTKAPAIIIAHPYGPLGGSMNNNVVCALQDHFLSLDYITVCLNFRGCGKSQGRTSWTGMPEREDYSSVIDFILDQHEDYKNLNFPQVNSLIICVRLIYKKKKKEKKILSVLLGLFIWCDDCKLYRVYPCSMFLFISQFLSWRHLGFSDHQILLFQNPSV